MCSLHDVHERNEKKAAHVRLPPCTIRAENLYMDLDEIWYRHYPTGDYPKHVLHNFLQQVTPT